MKEYSQYPDGNLYYSGAERKKSIRIKKDGISLSFKRIQERVYVLIMYQNF